MVHYDDHITLNYGKRSTPAFNFVIEKGIIIKPKKSEDGPGVFSHKVSKSRGKANVLGKVGFPNPVP